MKEKIHDPEEEAYNNAKKKIQSIHRAKRLEKKINQNNISNYKIFIFKLILNM